MCLDGGDCGGDRDRRRNCGRNARQGLCTFSIHAEESAATFIIIFAELSHCEADEGRGRQTRQTATDTVDAFSRTAFAVVYAALGINFADRDNRKRSRWDWCGKGRNGKRGRWDR